MAIYLDSSALMRRAEEVHSAASDRSQHAGIPVRDLLASGSQPAATCEVGLVEFYDTVTTYWRDTNPPYDVYDETWRNQVVASIMDDMADGRLEILQVPPKVIEQALALATSCTRDHGQKFRAWDAVHLIAAVAWALTLGYRVELWTTDDDFAGFVALYPHFAGYVAVRNLDD